MAISSFSVAKPYLGKLAVPYWIQFLISLLLSFVHYPTLIIQDLGAWRKQLECLTCWLQSGTPSEVSDAFHAAVP